MRTVILSWERLLAIVVLGTESFHFGANHRDHGEMVPWEEDLGEAWEWLWWEHAMGWQSACVIRARRIMFRRAWIVVLW